MYMEGEAAKEEADSAAHACATEGSFDIEELINVNSEDLCDICDMLADKPVTKSKPPPKQKEVTPLIAAVQELVESDWML